MLWVAPFLFCTDVDTPKLSNTVRVMTKNLTSSYEMLKNEVATFRDLVREAISQNPSVEQLYKGCTIMYSALLEGPPFLFIGINPGAGRYKETGKKLEAGELEPCDGFDYTNAVADGDYTLARETRDLFTQAGMYECLEKSVKTNVYYFMTSNEPDLCALSSSLGDDLDEQFHKNAFRRTRWMIERIHPKVIVCEGMSSLNKLSEIFDVSPTREGSCGSFELADETLVVGYSRQYSNIVDIPLAADFLRKKCCMRVQSAPQPKKP